MVNLCCQSWGGWVVHRYQSQAIYGTCHVTIYSSHVPCDFCISTNQLSASCLCSPGPKPVLFSSFSAVVLAFKSKPTNCLWDTACWTWIWLCDECQLTWAYRGLSWFQVREHFKMMSAFKHVQNNELDESVFWEPVLWFLSAQIIVPSFDPVYGAVHLDLSLPIQKKIALQCRKTTNLPVAMEFPMKTTQTNHKHHDMMCSMVQLWAAIAENKAVGRHLSKAVRHHRVSRQKEKCPKSGQEFFLFDWETE